MNPLFAILLVVLAVGVIWWFARDYTIKEAKRIADAPDGLLNIYGQASNGNNRRQRELLIKFRGQPIYVTVSIGYCSWQEQQVFNKISDISLDFIRMRGGDNFTPDLKVPEIKAVVDYAFAQITKHIEREGTLGDWHCTPIYNKAQQQKLVNRLSGVSDASLSKAQTSGVSNASISRMTGEDVHDSVTVEH
jgi:hypothetical protein